MPNAGEHQIGSIALTGIYWILSPWTGSLPLALLGIGIGSIGGTLPDILEPATWPGHRGAWHYIGGILSLFPALALRNSTDIGFLVGCLCVGYFSHFLLDVST